MAMLMIKKKRKNPRLAPRFRLASIEDMIFNFYSSIVIVLYYLNLIYWDEWENKIPNKTETLVKTTYLTTRHYIVRNQDQLHSQIVGSDTL